MKKSILLAMTSATTIFLAGCAGSGTDLVLPPDNAGSLAAFSQVAPYSEMLWKYDYNLDESKAGRHPLPPITARSSEEWEQSERPRTLQQFKDIMYGEMPPAPDRLRLELLSRKDDALDNTAVRKEIRLHCEMNNGRTWYFDMLLYVPKNLTAPPPVFVGLNFSGNQFNTPETDVRMTRSVYRDIWHDWSYKTFTGRGKKLEAWNYREAMERGYAVATAAYGEVAPDHMNGLLSSVFTLFYDRKDLRSDYQVPFAEHKGGYRRRVSIIGAWAWGLSRMLDALEQEPLVDAGRAAVIGHSRLGKAALWAGANDPRFKIVISNNSGCAGAALSRRYFGEHLRIMYWEQRPWLCSNVVRYINHPETLPIDQHQLLALTAPRNLYVASASEDLNADPKGEYLAAAAASKVWNLYGKSGLVSQKMPKKDYSIGKNVGYHIRTGAHGIRQWDWQQYYHFADQNFNYHPERKDQAQ